jgi:hypothetical protein
MIAPDNDTVAALNERARAHRVAVGEVRAHGIQADSGVVIGVDDLVVTRENNRLLSCGRGWVKNGDQWLVQDVAADGAVTVARSMGAGMPGGRQVLLGKNPRSPDRPARRTRHWPTSAGHQPDAERNTARTPRMDPERSGVRGLGHEQILGAATSPVKASRCRFIAKAALHFA